MPALGVKFLRNGEGWLAVVSFPVAEPGPCQATALSGEKAKVLAWIEAVLSNYAETGEYPEKRTDLDK